MHDDSQQNTKTLLGSSNLKILLGLIVLQVATLIPFGILSLLLDPMTEALGLLPSQSGVFFGVAGVGAAGGWFGGGWLLRHFSRAAVFKIVLVGEAGALLAVALSPSWQWSLLAFFGVGFCQCAALSAALSVATDLNPQKSAGNISLIMASSMSVPIFAWGTGCLLSHGSDWRMVLGLAAIPLVVSAIWMSFLNLPSHQGASLGGDEDLVRWSDLVEFPVKFFFPALMSFAGFTITICIYGWAGIVGERLLGGIEKASYAAGVMLFGIGFGQLMIGTWWRDYSPRKLMLFAAGLMLFFSVLLLMQFTHPLIWLLFLALGIAGGMIQPLTISLAEKEMGSTSHRSIAVIGLWGEGGAALVYYLIGYFGDRSDNFVSSFAVAMMVGSIVLLMASANLRRVM